MGPELSTSRKPIGFTREVLQGDSILIFTALIWGFAFIAQRVGMETMPPFLFNAIRFALGALVLLPFVVLRRPQRAQTQTPRAAVWLLGLLLFAGASFQQVGVVYTTAGKAGLITGLYVILVPIFGLFWHQKTHPGTWIGVVLATIGMYLLSYVGSLQLAPGDALVFFSAVSWALHVLLIGWLSPRCSPIHLAFYQFGICALLSLLVALAFEPFQWSGIQAALWPLLYAGLLSVGIAYTLQVVAQKKAPPGHAAVLLSMEGLFAALGGWWLLNESLGARGVSGAALIIGAMLISQLYRRNPSP